MLQLHLILYVHCKHSSVKYSSLPILQARDLGPRLFGAFVYGWNDVFRTHNYFFWVPIIGPILGGISGVWIYECYTSIVRNYGQLSNSGHKDPAETHREGIQTEEDASELRQQLTVEGDSH
jgi:hypothetical protein